MRARRPRQEDSDFIMVILLFFLMVVVDCWMEPPVIAKKTKIGLCFLLLKEDTPSWFNLA